MNDDVLRLTIAEYKRLRASWPRGPFGPIGFPAVVVIVPFGISTPDQLLDAVLDSDTEPRPVVSPALVLAAGAHAARARS
jgi:hypothetical protein